MSVPLKHTSLFHMLVSNAAGISKFTLKKGADKAKPQDSNHEVANAKKEKCIYTGEIQKRMEKLLCI